MDDNRDTPRKLVEVTPDAHQRLKVHCAKTGENIKVAATRAIVEYLKAARISPAHAAGIGVLLAANVAKEQDQ